MSTSTEIEDVSIVEYYAENEGYKCGYCKSSNTNYSHGMWAHSLTVHDYQDLIDRGWRRSGCYCYKPIMNLTCCPMYTIRCSSLSFKLSKSQKKKLKKVHNFLAYGKKKLTDADDITNETHSDSGDMVHDCAMSDFPDLKVKAERALLNKGNAVITSVEVSFKNRLKDEDSVKPAPQPSCSSLIHNISKDNMTQEKEESLTKCIKKTARPGDGMDPNRPKCKRAKLLRQERKEKKLAQLGYCEKSLKKPQINQGAKSLEDFINEPFAETPAHRLEIKLVSVTSHEMRQTLNTSWKVFEKYQMAIHKEEAAECDLSSFINFLVKSPLEPWKPKEGPPQGYGSFHQQYWLDGNLIAVGVIDILPNCVSSVYFFYDPEFSFLVLGTYGSLREIAFTRSLNHLAPNLRYYYMGFYIHSCQKMRYKGAFTPSFLLCPEVYTWHPIEQCLPLLEKNKYSRFNQDPEAKEVDQVFSVNDVAVIFQNEVMYYNTFLSHKQTVTHLEDVTQYATLVGNKLSKRMLLILT